MLEALHFPIDESVYKDWLPAKVFTNRKDSLTILKTYISDNTSSEVFSIRGSEGAGKTSLAYRLSMDYENAVFINNNTSLTGFNFIRFSLNKIIFNEYIFPKLNTELLDDINKILDNPTDIVNKLKSYFNRLSAKCSFILIFDAFNNYDDYTIDVWKNIIPILQVNKIKVILTENSDKYFMANFIYNLREVNLTPFTDAYLTEYLEHSFSSFFPKEELKRLIIRYADLLPGNIKSFIKDIILLKILVYTPKGIEIVLDDRSRKLLKSSHEEIYQIRFAELSDEEKLVSQFISAFEIRVNPNIILKYFSMSVGKLWFDLTKLEQKNIIHHVQSNTNPDFVSEGLKRFIYSTIKDKISFHSAISKFLYANFPDFASLELAKQFELAENYDLSYKILYKEVNQADKVSAYSYEKNILERLTNFPLSTKVQFDIKIKLSNVYFMLSQYRSSINIIDILLKETKEIDIANNLLFLKAKCLVGLTEYTAAKQIIESLLTKIKAVKERHKLLIELATVEFNLNNYDRAISLCDDIVKNDSSELEEKGQSYEMLGLISAYKNNDLNSAFNYFNKASSFYEKAKLNFQLAQNLMNIGIAYNIQGNHKKANLYWDKSLDINRSIGNIEQEAKLLMNYGILYYEILELDKAIEVYEKASSIFVSLGNKKGYGFLLFNLSEIYLLTCEYQKAIDYLNTAVNSFEQMKNIDEELEALFLLGKAYFILGDYENLSMVFKRFNTFSIKDELNEKHKSYLQLLTILKQSYEKPEANSHESLNNLRQFFWEGKYYYDYMLCTSFLVQNLIQTKELDIALDILNSFELIKICKKNLIFEAERNYLKGIIVNLDPTLSLKTQIDYLNIAYEKIEDTYITEITWKVLFELANIFNDRGNLKKAQEYSKYTLSIINNIANNIKDYRIKSIYLTEKGRKAVLDKLLPIDIKFENE